MENKDAFDLWWEWAEKPLDGPLTIDAEIHEAVMALPPDERRDRAKGRARRYQAWPTASRWECGPFRRSEGHRIGALALARARAGQRPPERESRLRQPWTQQRQ